LENKGKANEEGEFEKNVSNHVKGLVGLGAAGEGELDKKLKIDYKEIGEFYLVEYFEILAWDGDDVWGKIDNGLAMRKIKEDKDDYLEGFEIEDKFNLYLNDFKEFNKKLGSSE
jgi:hypothetical protein